MKLLKTLTVGLVAAAATASTASAAPQVIHVVGSTAFRAGTTMAIIDTLAGNTPGVTGTTQVFGACATTDVSGAGQAIFANGTIGTGGTASLIVETSWTGSLAGVVDLVAQSSTAQFYDETNATVIAGVNNTPISSGTDLLVPGAGPTSGLSLTTSGTTKAATSIEMAMSDSVKGTISKELAVGATFASGFSSVGHFTSLASLATACGNTTISDAGTSDYAGGSGVVAIVPFQWVSGNITGGTTYPDSSTVAIPTNITTQVARQLITSGYAPQAQFTGTNKTADTKNFFFFTGRNEDSGTRIGYLMESQFGVANSNNPVQWAVGDGSTTTAGTQPFPITPLNTEPAIVWNVAGHSGYSGGSNVAAALKIAESGSVTFGAGQPGDATGNNYFISCLGLSDAFSITGSTAGSANLTFNGVAYSPATVQNGTYSMWEFEHCYRLRTPVAAVATFVNNCADNIFATDCDALYSTSTGLTHSENTANGTYIKASNGSWPPGVKFDVFCKFTRSTTEGGPISAQF